MPQILSYVGLGGQCGVYTMPSPDAAAIPHASDLQSTPIRKGVKHKIWLELVIGLGFVLSGAWTGLLVWLIIAGIRELPKVL
jgi:hypothetical protein